jgi:hypothetical protein
MTMAWRAAATFLSGAVFLLACFRIARTSSNDPVRLFAIGMVAAIVAIAAFGAFNLTLAVALLAGDVLAGTA